MVKNLLKIVHSMVLGVGFRASTQPTKVVALRTLAKRYRNIRNNSQALIDQLQLGNFIGDKIAGTGYTVFRVRLKNSDIQKGKSAGYRVVYQLRDNLCVLMILIYSKSDHSDIAATHIRNIINQFEQQ